MTSPRRKALALSFFTVGYNLAEGVVGIIGVSLSGSVALLGFGLDSFVESLSGSVIAALIIREGYETFRESRA